MRHTTLTDFRSHIAQHLDAVENDRVELVVTRQNHEPCVVLPLLAELEGLRETLHLLASRATRGTSLSPSPNLKRARPAEAADEAVKLVFTPQAWADYLYWQEADAGVLARQRTHKGCVALPLSGSRASRSLWRAISGVFGRDALRASTGWSIAFPAVSDAQALEIVACRYHYD